MSRSKDSSSHGHALRELSQARHRALDYLEKVRSRQGPGFDGRLVPVDECPKPITQANAAIASYVMQIRPYRDDADPWNRDIAVISLPESRTKDAPGRSSVKRSTKLLRENNRLRVRSLADFINVANMKVGYGNRRSHNTSLTGKSTPSRRIDSDTLRNAVVGNGSLPDLLERADPVEEEDDEPPQVSPDLSQADEVYLVVFTVDELLRVFETADECLAELDMLADVATSGGASYDYQTLAPDNDD